MTVQSVSPRSQVSAWEQPASWLILLAMLLLRIPLLGWLPVWDKNAPSWLEPVYQVSTYALTAIFLFTHRDRLGEFHIDRLAVVLILAFKPLQTLLLPLIMGNSSMPMAFPQIPALGIWAIAGAALPALWASIARLPKIRPANWAWLGIGAVSGVVLSLAVGFALIPLTPIQNFRWFFDYTLILAFPYQVGYAGVDEEPLFRGFLWGQLRKTAWRAGAILVFQAALFTLAHGRLFTSITVLPAAAAIFAGGIVFGLLVLRSRSIATSILAHGVYNGFNVFTALIVNSLLK